jgi:hypothetical protein
MFKDKISFMKGFMEGFTFSNSYVKTIKGEKNVQLSQTFPIIRM